MGEFDDVIAEFLIESREGLDQLDRDLVALEDNPQDRETLARIFRCFHTVKGTSGFLAFSKLEELTHAGENLLSRMRDGTIVANATIINALLETVDSVRYMLGEVEAGGNDGDGDYTAQTETLKRLNENGGLEEVAADEVLGDEQDTAVLSEDVLPRSANLAPEKAEPGSDLPVPAEKRASLAPSQPSSRQPSGPPADPHDTHAEVIAASSPHPPSHREESEARPAAVPESVRVDVELLDNLVDLAGELVLTRNHIVQMARGREDTVLAAASQRLNFVTAQLQDGIMRMRMQPVSTLFSKFPRVVRDLARTCKKQVRLELDGRDTELDKSLIEAIKDPLTHLIRNCVDHGIEPPEVRVARGKHPEGRVELRAYHQNGLVHIEIADDGGGVAIQKVRSKAVSRGLLSAERAQAMTDAEVAALIFLPGFSTADQVTNVSGRGVGMDVVKTNVEQAGGTVEVDTKEGHGTTFTLKIPLTLAIMPALIVRCADNRYAVPQVNVIELVRIGTGLGHQELEWIHGAPVYRLRGKLLPIVFLEEALGGSVAARYLAAGTAPANDNADAEGPARFMAVVQGSGRSFGLVVDAVLDQQEIVVKPLPKLLSEIGAFAGATLLGDGRIALILDILGIAQRASLTSEMREDIIVERSALGVVSGDGSQTLLLLRGPGDARLAVPLELVSRLETFDRDLVESGGTGDVVQYRGEIMPLLLTSELLPERRARMRDGPYSEAPPSRQLSVVVLGTEGRPLGLVVDDVLDVVEAPGELRRSGCRAGVIGTLVVQERVTEVLDLEWITAQMQGAA